MNEAFTVTLCQCGHSPSEHIHEKYMCKAQGCTCKEVVECVVYMQVDTRLPEVENLGALTQALDRLKKWGNA